MVTFLLEPRSWQAQHWNKNECSIEPMEGGKFAIVDHSIQTMVAEADTEEEAEDWLN